MRRLDVQNLREPVAIVGLAVALLSGCRSFDGDWRRLFDDARTLPPVVVAPDAPEPRPEALPDPVTPEPPAVVASTEMQWFERDGRVVIRIDASRGPRGYSIVTANGHKDIDPRPPMTEAQWLGANNGRPPHRIVDGYAEWTLDRSGADIAAAASAYGRNSGPVVMLFCKVNPSGDVSYWINPTHEYGTNTGRTPVRNLNNYGWEVER